MTQKEPKTDNKDTKKSLLRSGLTSEYYLLSFIKPDKPYRIAKILKNTTSPDVSKVYPAQTRLVKQGYLEKKGEIYYPVYSKLAQEIAEMLKEKNEILDDNEIKLLIYFLRNNKFVKLLYDDVTQMIQSQKIGIRNVDTLKFIATKIAAYSLFLWLITQKGIRYIRNITSEHLEKEE